MKTKFTAIVLAACAALAGCQTTQPDDDPEIFGRTDCKRAAGNPEVVRQYEVDSEVCKHRAQAAMASGVAPIRDMSFGGSLERYVVGERIGASVVLSCMAERGYLRRKRSQHDAFCATTPAQKKRA